MLHRICILIIFLCAISVANAQKAKHYWVDGLCEYEGTFDSTKISRKALENSFDMAGGAFGLETPTIFFLNDIGKIDVPAFDKEYQTGLEQLKNLDLPKGRVWQAHREEMIREITEIYKAKRIELLAFGTDQPVMLRELAKPDSCTNYYADALIAGGDQMLEAWKYLTSIQAPKNGNPQMVWVKYNQELRSADKFRYAKLNLLTYGWWNCANHYIFRADQNKMYKDITRLLIDVKQLGCDEP